MSSGPLRDILVCDFTVALAGPITTYGLAQLGARVIKIERTHEPEREIPLVIGNPVNGQLGWASRSGGKESIKVDLSKPDGNEVIRRLLARSDVVVENFRPGAMERLGLDWDTMHQLNPRLIYASLKGYNPDSPWGNNVAYDTVTQAAGGAMSVTGYPDGPPIKLGLALSDFGTGTGLLAGILAGLVQRRRTGEGQRVFISMLDGSIHYMRPIIAKQVASGVAPVRQGNLDPDPALKTYCETFACKGDDSNDYCIVEVDTDSEWRSLVAVTQLEAVGRDARFATADLRYQHADALREALAPWFATRTKQEAMECLVSAGIRAAAVLTPYDFMRDQTLWGEDMFSEMQMTDGTSLKTLAWPVKFSTFKPTVRLGPGWGEHNDKVLGELGYSTDEIAALSAGDVI